MYRYSVDNAITYTPEDFVLFRESSFACWMERLSLENPDHGIPPDINSSAPHDPIECQDELAQTLRDEGRDVSLIEWGADEDLRRGTTLGAMRSGVDFIVNGQLALGPLSGAVNLLMRTSGYSQLGDFLYIPCDTQARSTADATFRLCFLADLLHSLQGQLPPQMLIIRGDSDLIPLQTEDHIYHYRAVKHRFMDAMRNFRKHRMPDPAESTHFGRWSDCAHEVLKQRVLREEAQEREEVPAAGAEPNTERSTPAQGEAAVSMAAAPMPLQQAVGGDAIAALSTLSPESYRRAAWHDAGSAVAANQGGSAILGARTVAAASAGASRAGESTTLVEQARMLMPGAYTPGPGRHRFPPRNKPADTAPITALNPRHNRRASDAVLQNLEFVGSSNEAPMIGGVTAPPPALAPVASSAPAPSLRDPGAGWLPGQEQRAEEAPEPVAAAPARSVIDMDSSLPVTPSPGLATAKPERPAKSAAELDEIATVLDALLHERRGDDTRPAPISSSLITGPDNDD